MNKTIAASNAPAAVGPYCHAKLAGGTLYTSGQLGLIPATGELAQGVEAQAAQALDNLKAVLEAAGMGLEDVVSGRALRVKDVAPSEHPPHMLFLL